MPKGNPNPNMKGLKPFKPGQSGNPGGISKERKRLMNEAAERAARIMARQLEALEGLMNEHPEKERIVSELINADIHRIVKDALDRADGTPRQSVDHTSSDNSMSPKPAMDWSKAPPEVLEWVIAQGDAAKRD